MLVDGEIRRICITLVDEVKEVREIPANYHPAPKSPEKIKGVKVYKTPVAIVGAGPAGLAVREELNRHGIGNIVIDSNDRIGGQFLMQTHQFFKRRYAFGEPQSRNLNRGKYFLYNKKKRKKTALFNRAFAVPPQAGSALKISYLRLIFMLFFSKKTLFSPQNSHPPHDHNRHQNPQIQHFLHPPENLPAPGVPLFLQKSEGRGKKKHPLRKPHNLHPEPPERTDGRPYRARHFPP
jgi:hypothetical protein